MYTETEAPTRVFEGITERNEFGLVILGPTIGKPRRRVIYINSYGGSARWAEIKKGRMPTHHLYGCLELARMGYEVAIAEPLSDFYLYRKPLPHDLVLWKAVKSWLGRDGIVYCGHNVLYWLPLLRSFGIVGCHVVSLIFAREPLAWARSHSGIIALTPPAADHARKLAPRVKSAHLGWGCDLEFFPHLPYDPETFLSCGLTHRDHQTLAAASRLTTQSISLVCPQTSRSASLSWGPNVQVVNSLVNGRFMDPKDLLERFYPRAAASLIVLNYDPIEYTAVGFTELIELMAMARPVIVSRTGALPAQIDVEKEGCGLLVPPRDPDALAAAIDRLASDPKAAEEMGNTGRRLAEKYYNTGRYSLELHQFFESL
jgi:glycosyltransferase involved in cell wall biosynthesis